MHEINVNSILTRCMRVFIRPISGGKDTNLLLLTIKTSRNKLQIWTGNVDSWLRLLKRKQSKRGEKSHIYVKNSIIFGKHLHTSTSNCSTH